MKLALVLAVIDPLLGGVLVMGHRGTAKSTAVRGLAELLPPISSVANCSYRCDPAKQDELCWECTERLAAGQKLPIRKTKVEVVELPLGATEDRVCGSIDIEKALRDGVKAFQPGLLARANRSFLYIDEVNLLEDHLVDLLLDVSASGRNRVERESISINHPSRFVLIGSGNPEEGELRPQLLDRFGLHVEVVTENDLEERIEIIRRRERFDADPVSFNTESLVEQQELRKRIARAQKLVAKVAMGETVLRRIAELCAELKVDGHRGEITIAKAARALAALENRHAVTDKDIKRVAVISLRHRLRRSPFDETGSEQRIRQALEKIFGSANSSKESNGNSAGSQESATKAKGEVQKEAKSLQKSASPQREINLESGRSKADIEIKEHRQQSRSRARPVRGKSNFQTVLNSQRGRYSRSTANKRNDPKVAVEATLRAALAKERRPDVMPWPNLADHLRYKVFRRKEGSLYILAIDTSGSMALRRIKRAREIALGLLHRSYVKRDHVAVVVFRGDSATLALPPTRSILRAKKALDHLSLGGATPLAAGIVKALELAKLSRVNAGNPVMVLFTDGGANVPLNGNSRDDRRQRRDVIAAELTALGTELKKAELRTIVVDTEDRNGVEGAANALATRLGAELLKRSASAFE